MGHYDELYDEVICARCKTLHYKRGGVYHIGFIKRLKTFVPYKGEYLCARCFDYVKEQSEQNKEFLNGIEVEIRNKEYEFYLKEMPTGNYARGIIIDMPDEDHYTVKLTCNGTAYDIDKTWLFTVTGVGHAGE